jgi:hypothetical protein
VGERDIRKKEAADSNIIPAPASLLLDIPARRDDGSDCAFRSTDQSSSMPLAIAERIDQTGRKAWSIVEVFANERTHERPWNRPSYNKGPGMRPLSDCHNASRRQQCPDDTQICKSEIDYGPCYCVENNGELFSTHLALRETSRCYHHSVTELSRTP